MRPGRLSRRSWLLLAAGLTLGLAAEAWARAGGGDTFSGGRSFGGGHHGGGDDSGLLSLVFWLLFNHPQIGVPVAILVAIFWIAAKARDSRATEWQSLPTAVISAPPGENPKRKLLRLREEDPDFSLVVFEDFLYALYARVQQARGRGALAELSPWLEPGLDGKLARGADGLVEVRDVVVGAMKLVAVRLPSENRGRARVAVLFESNYTERHRQQDGGEADRRYYAVERWTLERKAGARSRPPQAAAKFGCPSCGAALDAMQGNRCSYCGTLVRTGELDWALADVELFSSEPRPPELGGEVEEEGTDLPTLVDPQASSGIAALEERDAGFKLEELNARATMIFLEMQQAWSSRDWSRARPFVTDNLFQTQVYWMEAFKRRGLRNVVEQTAIERIELAQVASDAWFDSVTVRIFASGLDYYVADAGGRVVSGSPRTRREFSEYWTLVRGVGTRGRAGLEKKCPNCGAPLQVSQAGQCQFCQARVTSGEFDWVVSRIEQDEAYRG